MPVAHRSLTLADVALPRTGALQNVLLVVVASLVTAAAAQLEIHLPWTPVTITGQTFAVLLAGATLGARRAFLAQALYLFEGACGMPFFAGGAGGVLPLLGPSGGYLLAFPFAALVTGVLAGRAWDRRPFTMFAAMLAGNAVILALGLAQLSRFVSAGGLLAAGLLPFVAGDVLKAALAAGLTPALWKWLGASGSK
jgi:biotin transport system substrate-specific component